MQLLGGQLCPHFHVDADGKGEAKLFYRGVAIATLQSPNHVLPEGGKAPSYTLDAQLAYVRGYSDLRIDRSAEIQVQLEDILSFFGQAARLNSRDREATLETLALVQGLCIPLEMQIKHGTWMPRPAEIDPRVLPVIQTPDHSSFPAGHAVEPFAVATVLDRLMFPTASDGLTAWRLPYRIAHRIALNRVIAGVHFPIDIIAGAVVGIAIGEAFLHVVGDYASLGERTFRGIDYLTKDASRLVLVKAAEAASVASVPDQTLPAGTLKDHWAKTLAEWPDSLADSGEGEGK
ncbi:phosphatase PAP2 family protein [Hoeflea sp.]|uniref:phosphatase PAP2 family protein n=1 Tax=Hoeflea sp. TaxID=1940281 RepID=UPI003BB06747